MSIIRFDSLGYVQRLEDAGVPRKQAVVQAETFQETLGYYDEANRQALATKADVRETELRLQKEIEQVRANLSARIEEVRAELTAKVEEVRADLRTTELRLQKEIAHTKYTLLVWQITVSLALAGIMAKGFGWLGF